MQATVLFTVLFAGIEKSNKWVSRDVEKARLESVMLREYPLLNRRV